jgi:hypothetical protein
MGRTTPGTTPGSQSSPIGPSRCGNQGIDDVVANVSAGVEILDLHGTSFKLFYDGRFGDTIQENAAGAKATVPF